jgi:hypothetical protein
VLNLSLFAIRTVRGAAELVEFIRSTRLITMTTIGPAGQPHIASVHTELDGSTPHLVVYEDAVRRKVEGKRCGPREIAPAMGS